MSHSYQFEPHRASLGNIDANVLSLLAYTLGWIMAIIPILPWFAWFIPLAIFFLEKESPLVRFHAAQSFLLNLIVSILAVLILLFLGGSAFLTFSGTHGNVPMAENLSFGSILLALLLIAVLGIGSFVFSIIATVKAYHYQAYRIPVIGNWAAKIAGLDR